MISDMKDPMKTPFYFQDSNRKSYIVNRTFFVLLALFFSTALFADSTDYFSVKTLRYEDRIYSPNIKTIVLSSNPGNLAPAIIKLNTTDKLFLDFDDLDGDYKVYSFAIHHCDAKWEPSNILVSEYMDGFADNPISDYRLSRSPIQKYTHYTVSFPDENVKLLKSGNYVLEVFSDNNHENLAFTRRFMVFEEKVSVDVRVHQATIVADQHFKQEVDFTINFNSTEVTNPFAELIPVILQNNRWDNALSGMTPQFVKDQQLVFDLEEGNVFRGGNEFRFFNTRSLRYGPEPIEKIERDSVNISHVYLATDERRTYKQYLNKNDINGRFMVETQDGGENNLDADYCWVHFFLAWPIPEKDGNIYVFGAFSDWQCRPDNRMTYNYGRRGYEAKLYLKQGYYNYQYVKLGDKDNAADDFYVEGMHQETENDYMILVYYRKQGSWVDELVAVKRTNSRL